MSDQYTPPTVDVKVAYRLDGLGLMMSPDSRPYDPQETAEVDAEFERWLATVKAEAWQEGALWAAAECGVIKPDCPPEQWLTPGDNPYRSKS